jgi:hypothetical protein
MVLPAGALALWDRGVVESPSTIGWENPRPPRWAVPGDVVALAVMMGLGWLVTVWVSWQRDVWWLGLPLFGMLLFCLWVGSLHCRANNSVVRRIEVDGTGLRAARAHDTVGLTWSEIREATWHTTHPERKLFLLLRAAAAHSDLAVPYHLEDAASVKLITALVAHLRAAGNPVTMEVPEPYRPNAGRATGRS